MVEGGERARRWAGGMVGSGDGGQVGGWASGMVACVRRALPGYWTGLDWTG